MKRKLKEIKEGFLIEPKKKLFVCRGKTATPPMLRLDDLSTLQENFILQTCLIKELGEIEVEVGADGKLGITQNNVTLINFKLVYSSVGLEMMAYAQRIVPLHQPVASKDIYFLQNKTGLSYKLLF